MRSADDECESYILDEQFKRVYLKRPRFLPEWWRDAVEFSEPPKVYPTTAELVKGFKEEKARKAEIQDDDIPF